MFSDVALNLSDPNDDVENVGAPGGVELLGNRRPADGLGLPPAEKRAEDPPWLPCDGCGTKSLIPDIVSFLRVLESRLRATRPLLMSVTL